MPSRLSIFSSRVLGSAFLWTLLLIALIEGHQALVLPGRYFSHEVDRLLYDLEHGQVATNATLFLGDSVGRQVAAAILSRHPDAMTTLACSAAIETPGQYYLLERYLESHSPPRRVILMMGNPLAGGLRSEYTENYVERCFLRWHEIGELAWARRSLSFGLVMTSYKLCPTLRYRLHLQKAVPGLVTVEPSFGTMSVVVKPGEGSKSPSHGLLAGLDRHLARRSAGPTIAEDYFRKLCKRLEQQGVELIYLPIPVAQAIAQVYAPGGRLGCQLVTLRGLQPQYAHLKLCGNPPIYPDNWFADGTHLKPERVEQAALDYEQRLAALGFAIEGGP